MRRGGRRGGGGNSKEKSSLMEGEERGKRERNMKQSEGGDNLLMKWQLDEAERSE